MRKKDDSLREQLLNCARELADKEGTDHVNIRSIARQAGVAVGTVYNYFESKDDILLALTEEYWHKALLEMETVLDADSFCGIIEQMYGYLRWQIRESGGMLMRSLGDMEAMGVQRMAALQQGLVAGMRVRLDADRRVKDDIWDEIFTKEQYMRFILTNLIALLRTDDGEIGFFLEIMRRTLY